MLIIFIHNCNIQIIFKSGCVFLATTAFLCKFSAVTRLKPVLDTELRREPVNGESHDFIPRIKWYIIIIAVYDC